jgi:transposase-like protein
MDYSGFCPTKDDVDPDDLKTWACGGTVLVKNGKSENGTQQWRCNQCRKHFRREYRYKACKTGTKEKIIEMTMNSSGVRDIGRVLKISKDTVCSVLKKR